MMSALIFFQYLFCSLILLREHARNLRVNHTGTVLAVRLCKHIVLTCRVIVAYIWQRLAHSIICHDGIRLFRRAFKVVERSCRHAAEKQVFCCTTAKQRANLVKQRLLWRDLTLFWQIPGGSESLAARHNGYFDQRIGIFQMPAYCGMACLMGGD